jgi:hypothetical protein
MGLSASDVQTCYLQLSLETSLARGEGWGSELQEFHIKWKGPLMQGKQNHPLPFHPMSKLLSFQVATRYFFQILSVDDLI